MIGPVISGNTVLRASTGVPSAPLIGWRNLVTISNVSADQEDPGYPATNLANDATFLEWRGTSNVAQRVTVNTNQVDPIDYVGIARHNFGSGKRSLVLEGATGELDGGDGLIWTELTALAPKNDAPILLRFEEQSLQQIRLSLSGGIARPHAAVLYVGKLLDCRRGVRVDAPFTPIVFGRQSESVTGRSERGDFMGRTVVSEFNRTVADFRYFDEEWYREHFDPFIVAGAQRPFFFVIDPDNHPREVGFCWFTDSDPVPEFDPPTGRMHIVLNLNGLRK